jgi:hypothetical protein
MAVNDIRSNLISQFLGSVTVAADDTTELPGVIDGAEYELGVMFSVQVTTVGTATSVDLVIQESDDPTFATFDTIDSTSIKIIGTGSIDITALSIVPTATASLTTENRLVTVGVFSNLRYLRPAFVDVGGNGAGVASVFAVQKAEEMPTVDSDA